jgi:hypothetical protein
VSVETLVITMDVPSDQLTAADAAAASAVSSLQSDVDGLTVLSAVFGGSSLLPTPAEAFTAALDALQALSKRKPAPSHSDVVDAIEAVDRAGRALAILARHEAENGPEEAPGTTAGATVTALPEEPASPAPVPAAE